VTIYTTKLNIILLLFIVLSAIPVYAQFAGGSGTESDPWQVATAEQLNNVRNYSSQHFIQTADIILEWHLGAKELDGFLCYKCF